MLEVLIAALAALAIRDLIYEIVEQYRQYKWKRYHKLLQQLVEDWEADDDF